MSWCIVLKSSSHRDRENEWEFESKWPPPAAPESRVSPEWPKPQSAESRVSEENTRDSLVTRRTHSDPTKRKWPSQVCYRSDKWTCRASYFFFEKCCYRIVNEFEHTPLVMPVVCRASITSDSGKPDSCVILSRVSRLLLHTWSSKYKWAKSILHA